MTRKGIALLLVLLLCLGALAGCTSEPTSSSSTATGSEPASSEPEQAEDVSTSSEDPVKIYMIGSMPGGAAWGQCEQGFMTACEELGWEGHYLAPSQPSNTTEMVNLVETALTNGADIVMPNCNNVEAFADVISHAKELGIPMVGISNRHEDLVAYIGMDPTNLGQAIAEALVQAAGDDPINVVTVQTSLGQSGQNQQREAFEAKLLELRPDAVIVGREECTSNAATAQDKISALKLANPELNCAVSFDSYAGLGAATFVEANGLQGEFHVVGIDDSPEILMCVENGLMDCTVAQMWYSVGYDGVYLAKRVYDGEEVDFANDAGSKILFPEDLDAWIEERGIDMSAS